MVEGRMIFVEQMQDFIVRELLKQGAAYLNERTIRRALDQWNAGAEFTGRLDPVTYALFETFAKVQKSIEDNVE